MKKIGVLILSMALAACGGGATSGVESPVVLPTATPMVVPTAIPIVLPTATPSVVPTATPMVVPTATPMVVPTATPSVLPTAIPIVVPTTTPSVVPTATPSVIPTATPSVIPTATPSVIPTATPSVTPTVTPAPLPLDDFSLGKQKYENILGSSGSCASCHGDTGLGIAGRGGPVVDCGANCDSFSALETKIDVSMPIGNSGDCRGECATQIATYIWQGLMGKSMELEVSCDVDILKASPMRRLNKNEIAYAIDDVFGLGGSAIISTLPNESEVIGGFATVGSALTTSRDWTESYINGLSDAADLIVDGGVFTGACNTTSPVNPIVDLPQDQCNTTDQCRTLFGSTATDCSNSPSDMSICMCGTEACSSVSVVDAEACFNEAIAPVGRRLYRRSLNDEELTRLFNLRNSEAETNDGLKVALVALLSSPNFLFSLPADDKSIARPLSEVELADRLALSLWGSVPDEALLDLAEQGRLFTELDATISRMLADDKFERFVEIFAAPWIGLGAYNLEAADLNLSEQAWSELRADMLTETRMFLAYIFENNRPIDEIYTANYSFINARLATHYGLQGTFSTSFELTNLPDSSRRRGLMTHASVLAKAFDGEKTSVVKRGVLPLEAFSCNAPEPSNDPDVLNAVNEQASSAVSEKEKIAERADTSKACAGCHAQIDPVGWVFTEFGNAGEKVMTDPDGDALDTSGELYGQPFNDIKDMIDIIVAEQQFAPCFANKFLIHSLGRKVSRSSSEDACAIDSAIERATNNNLLGSKDLLRALLSERVATQSGTIQE